MSTDENLQVRNKAEFLFSLGYRAIPTGGESADYFDVKTPDELDLGFADRFDEPTGINNNILGFKQVSGSPVGTSLEGIEISAALLKELCFLSVTNARYSIKQFLDDLSALKSGEVIVEGLRSWIKKHYNDVEIQIIMASPATNETLLMVLLTVDDKVKSSQVNEDIKRAFIALAKEKIPGLADISI